MITCKKSHVKSLEYLEYIHVIFMLKFYNVFMIADQETNSSNFVEHNV